MFFIRKWDESLVKFVLKEFTPSEASLPIPEKCPNCPALKPRFYDPSWKCWLCDDCIKIPRCTICDGIKIPVMDDFEHGNVWLCGECEEEELSGYGWVREKTPEPSTIYLEGEGEEETTGMLIENFEEEVRRSELDDEDAMQALEKIRQARQMAFYFSEMSIKRREQMQPFLNQHITNSE